MARNTLGTDPNNPDSDGDGILDGDEVALGADPAVEGEGNDGYVAPPGLDPSVAIGREVFAAYTELKNSGELNDEAITDIFHDVVDRHGDIVHKTHKRIHLRTLLLLTTKPLKHLKRTNRRERRISKINCGS